MSAAIIKLGLLMLVFVPLLIYNLRTGDVATALLGAMLAIGVLAALFGPYLGAAPITLTSVVGWALVALLLLALGVAGVVPGGIAKFLIALLPWFALDDYLFVVAVGMVLAAIIGWMTGKNALIVPPIMAASLAVGLMTALSVNPF